MVVDGELRGFKGSIRLRMNLIPDRPGARDLADESFRAVSFIYLMRPLDREFLT